MAAQTKFQDFVEQLLTAKHDLTAAGHVVKAMLVLSPAPVATNSVKADLTEIAGGNGYTAGGADIQNAMTETSGTATITATDVVWTASGGAIANFRYPVFYNDTQTSPADPLISFLDYGSTLTINTGETFTLDFGASFGTLT